MSHYRITPASRDAAAERRAQARRDAGMPPQPEREKCPHANKVEQHFTYGYRMHRPD